MTFRALRERQGFKGYRAGVRLSAATGGRVKQTAISQFDQGTVGGDPRWSTVEALAQALGVTEQIVMRAIRNSIKAAKAEGVNV